MIGYFIETWGPEIGNIFDKYIDEYKNIYIKKYIRNKHYGKGLELLLIRYRISGKFRKYEEIKPEVLNYSKKNNDIGVVVRVKAEDFLALSDQQKKQLLADTTKQAVLDVRKKLEKKKLDINFDQLLKDLEEVNAKYLCSK
ncbi:MAG: hypothetical protein WC788_01580 [Candidatus Paceibacterota bacterium]|jgi:hypothetical protein